MIQWAGILILRQAGYFFSGVDPASVQLHRAGRRDPQTWRMDLPQENFLNPLFVNYIVDDFFYNYHYLNDDGISKLQIDSCTVSCFSVCAINKIPLLKGEKKIFAPWEGSGSLTLTFWNVNKSFQGKGQTIVSSFTIQE